MAPPPEAVKKMKYTWLDVPRVDPSKRSAKERVGDSHEVYSLYDEATVRAQAGRCVQCGVPYCREGCALHNRIPEWLALVAEGKFREAAAILLSTTNMPEVCSRLCPQERLCENMCVLIEKGDPVPIGAIEKFIIEWAFMHGPIEMPRAEPNGMSVAIVGSGPAGLSCADGLATKGYAVTVFESQPFIGGFLVSGIPSFKLERSVVERRVETLTRCGVVFRVNCTVGRDISLQELLGKFDTVFLAMGARQPRPLKISGADLKGVHQASPFLLGTKLGSAAETPPIQIHDKHFVVLGGGDTAMDCLRAAIRGGARTATCVYRRDLSDMPAAKREHNNALEEGAKFVFCADAFALEGDSSGNVRQILCARTQPCQSSAESRPAPTTIPNTEFAVPAEVVVVAHGFDSAPLPQGAEWSQIALNSSGTVVVNEDRLTTLPRVFCGGSQIRGADLVGLSVCDGRQAADGIHRFLARQKAPAVK